MASGALLGAVIDLARDDIDDDSYVRVRGPSIQEIREGHRMAKVLSRNASASGGRGGSHNSLSGETLPDMVLDLNRPRKKTATEKGAAYQQSLKRTFGGLLKHSLADAVPFTDYILDSSADDSMRATQTRQNAGRSFKRVDRRSEGRASFTDLYSAAQEAGPLDDNVSTSAKEASDVSVEVSRHTSKGTSRDSILGSLPTPSQTQPSSKVNSTSEVNQQEAESLLRAFRTTTRAASEDSLIPADAGEVVAHEKKRGRKHNPTDGPVVYQRQRTASPNPWDLWLRSRGNHRQPSTFSHAARSADVSKVQSAQIPTLVPVPSPVPAEQSSRRSPAFIIRTVKRLVRDHREGLRRMFEQNGSTVRQRGGTHGQRSKPPAGSYNGPPSGALPAEHRCAPTAARSAAGVLTPALLAEKPAWANRPPCQRLQPFTQQEKRKIVELWLFHRLGAPEIASWFPGRSPGTINTVWNKKMEQHLEEYLTPLEFAAWAPRVAQTLVARNSKKSQDTDKIAIPASYIQALSNAGLTHGAYDPQQGDAGQIFVATTAYPVLPNKKRGRPPKARPDPAAIHRPTPVQKLGLADEDSAASLLRDGSRPRRDTTRPQDYYAGHTLDREVFVLRSSSDGQQGSSAEGRLPSSVLPGPNSASAKNLDIRPVVRRVRRSQKGEPQPDPRPYLTFAERQVLQQGFTSHLWTDQGLTTWKGVRLHVDFSPAELDKVRGAAQEVFGVEAATAANPLDLIRDATDIKLQQISFRILNSESLSKRTRDDVEAFLSDLKDGIQNRRPSTWRLGPPNSLESGMSSLLRTRELGERPLHITRTLQGKMLEDLRPSKYFEKTSGDVGTVAWAPDGETFAAGSMALVDQDSMQYNVPNNLLVGDIDKGEIRELAEHYQGRERTAKGPNATHEMHVTQDPRLFTTVSHVQFSPDGSLLYSAGYDGVVRYWNTTSSVPRLVGSISHEAPVDLLAVKMPSNNMDKDIIATGCQRLDNSIKVIRCHEDGPDVIASYSSATALEKPDAKIHPSALQWGIHGAVENHLLAGFATDRPDGHEGPATLGGISIWDLNNGAAVSVWPQPRYVFDVAWSPHAASFAVACKPNNRFDRNAKSTVKLYDPKDGGAFAQLQGMTLECPASDINDIVFSPYDRNLVSLGCTDGSVYVYDIRRPDQVLHQLSHGEPLQTMHYETMLQREKLDTGVRFTSWSYTRDRLCTGSSDGVVTLWDPYRATVDAKRRDLVQLDSGVMSGAFSPDYTKLLVGSVNGRIDVLEIGAEHSAVCTAEPMRKLDADAKASSRFAHTKDTDEGPGVSAARELCANGVVEIRDMGALPIRQAVQGRRYEEAPFIDRAPDAEALRANAAVFQARLLDESSSAANQCTVKKCVEYSKGLGVTAEGAGDSGRSADRIPHALREAKPDNKILPGMARCTECGRPARPRPGEDSSYCEGCSFPCLRCGGEAYLSSSRTNCVECASCGGVWRANVLGYDIIVDPSPAAYLMPKPVSSWQRQSQRWAKGITRLKEGIKHKESVTDDDREALGETVAYLDDVYSRFEVNVDEDF